MSIGQFRERMQIVINGKPPAGGEFWLSLWTAAVPTALVLEVLNPETIHEMRTKKPENLASLIKHAVAELRNKIGGIDGALRSLEVLTRVIPAALKPGEDDFESKYLFPTAATATTTTTTEESNNSNGAPALGDRLLDALLDLLFEPGFCVDSRLRELEPSEVVPLPTHCWAPGLPGLAKVGNTSIGTWAPCGGEAGYMRRMAVLRCLLACLTGSLHNSVEKAAETPNRFIARLVDTEHIHPRANGLFFSLMNIVLSYDPVGWGLPYSYLFSSSVPQQLMEACLSTLGVLLAYRNGFVPGLHEMHPNYFVQILRKLRKPESFTFLYSGLVRILEGATTTSDAAYLYEKRSMECAEGIIALLFIVLFYNKNFIEFVSIEKEPCKLLVPVMHTILVDSHITDFSAASSSSSPESVKKLLPITEICLECLLVLSTNTEFCNSLNGDFSGFLLSVVSEAAGDGRTRADIIIAPLLRLSSRMPVDSAPTRVLLIFLANVIPYIKMVSVFFAEKLCSLFIRASKPQFLAKQRSSYVYVATILEIITKSIVFQPQFASELIYSVICYEKDFLAFRNMTFAAFCEKLHTKKIEAAPAEGEGEGEGEAFVPTEEWFDYWKSSMIFRAIDRIYKLFEPRIKAFAKGDANDREVILNIIKTTNFVGVIPELKGISIRTYVQNSFAAGLFMRFVWVQAIKKCLLQFGTGIFRDTTLLKDPAGFNYVFKPETQKSVKKCSTIKNNFYTKDYSELEQEQLAEEEKKEEEKKEEEHKPEEGEEKQQQQQQQEPEVKKEEEKKEEEHKPNNKQKFNKNDKQNLDQNSKENFNQNNKENLDQNNKQNLNHNHKQNSKQMVILIIIV